RLAELLQELEPGIHSPVPPQKRGCLWKAPRVSGGCEARQAGRIGCGGRVASGSDRLKRRLPKRWLSESPAWGDQSAPGDRRTEWSVWVYPDPPRLDPSRGLLPQVYPQYLPRATRRRTSRGAVELPNGGGRQPQSHGGRSGDAALDHQCVEFGGLAVVRHRGPALAGDVAGHGRDAGLQPLGGADDGLGGLAIPPVPLHLVGRG